VSLASANFPLFRDAVIDLTSVDSGVQPSTFLIVPFFVIADTMFETCVSVAGGISENTKLDPKIGCPAFSTGSTE
jgi:hypothetical protein